MKRNIRIHLSFGCEPRSIRPLLVGALLVLTVGDLASESVTLTTYYPAPSGVYVQMITTGNTLLARDGGAASKVGIGTPTPINKLDVNGSAAIGTYAGSAPAAPANGLIVSGNVGIGTASPGAGLALDVVGKTRLSGTLAIAGTAPAGTHSYLYVDANGSSCAPQTTDNGTCPGYITWVPGIYAYVGASAGWWYTGPTFTVTIVNGSSDIVWKTPQYYCCLK